ncbi:MAG: hypothetical protein J7L11_06585 [Thermoprotei archaeon]|nr:hypothetical protein [Thermoprotei archaeon]
MSNSSMTLFFPRHTGRMLIVPPGRVIYGISLKGSCTMETVYDVLDVLRKRNLAVLQVTGSAPLLRDGDTLITLFLDFTNSKSRPETVASDLLKLKCIKQVFILKPVGDLLIDEYHFPLIVGNERVILLSMSWLRAMLRKTREEFGDGVEAFFYHQGRMLGEAIYDIINEFSRGDRNEFLRLCELFFLVYGMGILRIVEFKPDIPLIRVRIHHNFECELGKGSGRPYSHLVRGIIAGISSRFLNVKLMAIEEKCIAKGDPFCEFKVIREEE